jgi:hypothetical protein
LAVDHSPEEMREAARFHLWNRVVTYCGTVALVGISTAPLWAISRIAHAVAGKDTNVNVGITITVSLTLALGGLAGVIAAWRKQRSQRQELERARQREERLELQLEQAQHDARRERERADDLQQRLPYAPPSLGHGTLELPQGSEPPSGAGEEEAH